MRGALEIEADQMLALMPWVRGFPKHVRATFLSQFFENVRKEPKRASRFGVMQAITAVARDTADPEVRWRLEEFGGGVPVMRQPDPDPRPLAVTRRRARTSTEPSRAYNEMALSGGLLVE
jgi:hypothetical protein